MTWLSVLQAMIVLSTAFTDWLGRNQLLQAGEAENLARGLKAILDDIAKAHAARLAVGQLLSAIPAGCATMTASNGRTEEGAPFCLIAKPIYWSERDSDSTISAIKEHNAVGMALCGWSGIPLPHAANGLKKERPAGGMGSPAGTPP